jgi:hypothetical protein
VLSIGHFRTLFPNIKTSFEIDRISQCAETSRWPKPTITASINNTKADLAFSPNNNVSTAFFGANLNYVSDSTGTKSAAILNCPFDLYLSQERVSVGCKYLDSIKPDSPVLSDEVEPLSI